MTAARRVADETVRPATRGDLALASRKLEALSLPRFELKSPDFKSGDWLPTRCSVDGDGAPPMLSWGLFDPKPGSFALICEDPDAPGSAPFVHWLVYGISGSALSLDSNLNDFREGLNDKGEIGYAPAAPPRGSGPHRYCFQLFALDTELNLPEGRDYDRLISALSGHVVVWGELVGRYQRV
jgi:Raf kinase inhibitor-like YbhB/YbcL family protein